MTDWLLDTTNAQPHAFGVAIEIREQTLLTAAGIRGQGHLVFHSSHLSRSSWFRNSTLSVPSDIDMSLATHRTVNLPPLYLETPGPVVMAIWSHA